MAYFFGDGFDLYATTADPLAGYWDSGSTNSMSLVAGRFSGSQAISWNFSAATGFTKSSSANDAVHHLVCAVRNASTLSGTSVLLFFTLLDGVTAQCSVVFRSDGAVLLTSGGPAGTTLATYTGAVSAQNTWFGFEFEVVVNNASGSFTARKNGNTSNDFTLGSLNTRGGTVNNYANKLNFAMQTSPGTAFALDDLLWRSDAASVPWVGDIRCYTRMPASDASVQWTRSTGATNASCVDEAQQNGATDYVSDSTVNDADFYNIAPLAGTPSSTVGVTTRGFLQKSDAGARGAAVQLKSGASTQTSTATLLSTSFGWLWRADTVDPATGSAWSATGVNNCQIGPRVTS